MSVEIENLSQIRPKTEKRMEPSTTHVSTGGLKIESDGKAHLAVQNGALHEVYLPKEWQDKFDAFIPKGVTGLGISGANGQEQTIRRRLWFDHDIVPHVASEDLDPANIAQKVQHEYTPGGLPKVTVDPETKEVHPSKLVTWEDFQKTTTAENNILIPYFIKRLSGPTIEASATPQGGGVSLMNHDRLRAIRTYNESSEDGSEHKDMWIPMDLKLDTEICRELGVDPNSHWPDVTKKVHNINQDAIPKTFPESERRLTDSDKLILKALGRTQIKHYGAKLEEPGATFIIHDFQPSSELIKHIRKVNPTANIILRIHIALRPDLIDIDGSPQQETWDYWKSQTVDDDGNSLVDAVEFHPSREGKIEEFLPRGEHALDPNIVVFRPATTSPIDGLNKKLSPEQMDYYMEQVNDFLIKDGQEPLNLDRDMDEQIARFDESKNFIGAVKGWMEYRKIARERKIQDKDTSQLFLGGHGALDDPSGAKIFTAFKMLTGIIPESERPLIIKKEGEKPRVDKQALKDYTEMLNKMFPNSGFSGENAESVILKAYEYFNFLETQVDKNEVREFKDDIKFARLPHSDQMLNAVARRAKVALQLSHEEGCEVKISEFVMKRKPVIVANRGGMPRQIIDKKNGFIVEPDDHKRIGELLFTLHNNPELYARMTDPALIRPEYPESLRESLGSADSEYTTQADMRDWLGLQLLLEQGRLKPLIAEMRVKLGRQPFVKELLFEEYGDVISEGLAKNQTEAQREGSSIATLSETKVAGNGEVVFDATTANLN